MRSAESLVIACSDEMAVVDDDGTDQRIRLNPTESPGGLGQGPAHPLDVFILGEDSSHAPRLGFSSRETHPSRTTALRQDSWPPARRRSCPAARGRRCVLRRFFDLVAGGEYQSVNDGQPGLASSGEW